MGDRIAVFNKGRIEQLGAPLELYHRPANEFVATFLGSPRINLISRPAADADGTHRALWRALLPHDDVATARAGIRAEHLQVSMSGSGIPATVVLAEHLGDTSVLHLRVAGVAEMLHARLGAGHVSLNTGQSVTLTPDAAQVLRFDSQGQRLS